MKLKLLVIVALVVAGGAAVFVSVGGGLPFAGNANATQYLTAAASTGDVTDSVAATGTIAANPAYDLGFGAAPVAHHGLQRDRRFRDLVGDRGLGPGRQGGQGGRGAREGLDRRPR